MENFNGKEYRDNLAKDLKEIRKTDPEKAQEFLEEIRKTEEYLEAQRQHTEGEYTFSSWDDYDDGYGEQLHEEYLQRKHFEEEISKEIISYFNGKYTRDQIAAVEDSITENTKIYIGELEGDLFKKLPKSIERVYIEFPEKEIKLYTISNYEKGKEEILGDSSLHFDYQSEGIIGLDHINHLKERVEETLSKGKEEKQEDELRIAALPLEFIYGKFEEKYGSILYRAKNISGLEALKPNEILSILKDENFLSSLNSNIIFGTEILHYPKELRHELPYDKLPSNQRDQKIKELAIKSAFINDSERASKVIQLTKSEEGKLKINARSLENFGFSNNIESDVTVIFLLPKKQEYILQNKSE
jgi:hypothetical protein